MDKIVDFLDKEAGILGTATVSGEDMVDVLKQLIEVLNERKDKAEVEGIAIYAE